MSDRMGGDVDGIQIKLWRWASSNAIWVVLALLFIVAALLSDAFLRPVYIFNVVRQAAPVGIAAIGVTLVMILGGVDLSVGAVISLTAVLTAVLMDGHVANIPLAVTVALATGAIIGGINGTLIAYNRVSPFILTLGMAVVVMGITQIYSGGTARGIVSPGFREFFNYRIGGIVPVLALTFLGLALVGVRLQQTTKFCRNLYLIGSNPLAAELSGLPVRKITITAYALSGLMGAMAGIALLARSGVSSTFAGRGLEFDVLAAVILGGTTFQGGRGGIGGTIAAVFVLLIAFNLVNIVGLDYNAQLIVKGAIIIIASSAYIYFKKVR
ncbi:ABC transporter permease [Sneathiella sp. HT1-7]|uniref:ABC transporter permease n=1 Tax=Sneathiella sp. HT1-7 TaxID=2887192 RepID=UPI001D15A71A|nr:ABC transporter permease [Sneathiella sp. HT1-7]MCC3305214.1 ABC transporter permease [Sneathiella sp. HT1-7]